MLASITCDRLCAGHALFREKYLDTLGAVRLVLPGCEAGACQGLLAVGAGEALAVPGLVMIGDSS